jgi:hypothetical protein
VDAALLILERMGLSPDDLTAAPRQRLSVPTFADYVPVVSAAVTDGTRKAYGSYWNRVVDHWGARRLDEPTPSDIWHLMTLVKASAVQRRNSRGGRSSQEHLVAALRCLYRHAEDDGLIGERDNPARKVDKPHRLPSTRRAVADTRLAEINQVAATTGDDPELDTQIPRLHTETGRIRLGDGRRPGSEPAAGHRPGVGNLEPCIQKQGKAATAPCSRWLRHDFKPQRMRIQVPKAASFPLSGRPWLRAHSSTAARFQILPISRTASGSGNPSRLTSCCTRWRLTPSMRPISAAPTR